MNARLPSSKKWTVFPSEFQQQVRTVFEENFSSQLSGKKVIVEGRIYPEEILLRVGFLSPGELRQNNFEASVNYQQSEQEVLQKIHLCVDAIGSLMAEWFDGQNQEEELELPLSWAEYPFQGNKIFLKYSTENTELEAMANALLGDSEQGLYNEGQDMDSEDALAKAEVTEDLSGASELLSDDEDPVDLSKVTKH